MAVWASGADSAFSFKGGAIWALTQLELLYHFIIVALMRGKNEDMLMPSEQQNAVQTPGAKIMF